MAQPQPRPRRSFTPDPYRRLLVGVVLRSARDLQVANPRLRRQAVAFFDDEGIALAAALVGLSPSAIRRKVDEVRRE